MLSKRWSLKPAAPPNLLREYQGISPVLAQILYNRGFDTAQKAHAFLYVKADSDALFNPLQMKGMNKAVARIRQAIKRDEPIVVYGDFDADGVTSTTLLVQVFRSLGAKVKPYIPHRVDEGYGLNTRALLKLAQGGAKLVVTVDCGIRSVQQVQDGQDAGLDMIVTDHHSVGPDIEQLNEVAVAVVNPKQEDQENHPTRMLAGVGVAYKLADALIRVTKANGNRLQKQNLMDINTLLDLVAIGTVADLMPLSNLENRLLVTEGLKVLNRAERPGVSALLEVAGIKSGTMTASSIGFGLGPRINAAGRLESAMTAYHLLSAATKDEAKKFADRLQELNTQRQELTREAQERVHERLEEERDKNQPLIFVADNQFQAGIVGLVAGRVAEEFFRPAVIMEKGEEQSRASCRSIPQFDITRALDECADLLVRHGGHALAAGFTVRNENIETLKSRLLGIAQQQLRGQELVPTLDVDVEIDINQLSEDLVAELMQLEPMGNDNPQPVFMTKNVRVLECRPVGKDDRHLKLRIARAGQPPLDAIGFGLGEWASHLPERIDVAYYLEINDWNGRQYLQMNLRDIRASED